MTTEFEKKVRAIDALLPQTQCGLCDYTGCRPYAEAIAKREATIDHCHPGGIKTLLALAELLDENPEPYQQTVTDNYKSPQRALIREEVCIGCTKCIQACPTDAIIGSAKQMHTVISDACTGCELCIEPCPVDCIDLYEVDEPSDEVYRSNQHAWRQRYQHRQQRLANQEQQPAQQPSYVDRQAMIQAAVARARAKKLKGSV